MPAPTIYEDEGVLADYMLSVLDAIGTDLQLSASPTSSSDLGHFTEAVNDTLLQYGTDDVASITGTANITKLRAIARMHAWRLAKTRASALYNFSDGSQRLEREKVFDHCVSQLTQAEDDLVGLGIGIAAAPVVKITSLNWRQDPYGPFNPLESGSE